jgi:hypothetical protein
MPLQRPTPPTDVAVAFFKGVPEFVSVAADGNIRQGYVGSEPAAPTLAELGSLGDPALIHDVQQIFVLGLTDAADNAGAGAAAPAGWRFFAGNLPGKMLMGKVSRRTSSAGWKMTAAYYGDRVWAATQASKALEQLTQVQTGNYELRVLAVPGLNLEAFWLVAQQSGSGDLVVPFPAKPDQPIDALNREPVYTMANFLAAIRPVAQLRSIAVPLHGS